MKTRFYFLISDGNELPKDPYSAKIQNISFKTWFSSWNYQFPISFDFDAKTNTLFQDYIWPRFYNEIFFYVDVEHDPWTEAEEPQFEDYAAEACKKLGRIYSWLLDSQERYGQLINLYDAEKDNLMKQLGSKSTTLFNDTPQSGGDVTTSDYITNATTATTTADVGTPMARLKEIRDNLESLYNSWANEFRKFIIL